MNNVQNDWKDERLLEYVQVLSAFDIICNQEIFDWCNHHRRQTLITCAHHHGFPYYCHSPSAPLFGSAFIDGGLLILSRFPIVEQDFRPYKYCC